MSLISAGSRILTPGLCTTSTLLTFKLMFLVLTKLWIYGYQFVCSILCFQLRAIRKSDPIKSSAITWGSHELLTRHLQIKIWRELRLKVVGSQPSACFTRFGFFVAKLLNPAKTFCTGCTGQLETLTLIAIIESYSCDRRHRHKPFFLLLEKIRRIPSHRFCR